MARHGVRPSVHPSIPLDISVVPNSVCDRAGSPMTSYNARKEVMLVRS